MIEQTENWELSEMIEQTENWKLSEMIEQTEYWELSEMIEQTENWELSEKVKTLLWRDGREAKYPYQPTKIHKQCKIGPFSKNPHNI